jgi:hypothetical protein
MRCKPLKYKNRTVKTVGNHALSGVHLIHKNIVAKALNKTSAPKGALVEF